MPPGTGDDDPPPRLLKRWGIADPAPPVPIAPGRWRVDTASGSYFLKEHFLKEHGPKEHAPKANGLKEHSLKEHRPKEHRPKEHGADVRRDLRFRHTVTAALDAAGLPVLAPVPAVRGGRTLVTAGGRGYALYPWATGRRRGGLELTFGQCERLGGLLGELHAAMDRLTAPVQQSLLVPTPRAADAVAALDGMLAALPAGGNDFAALTERRLLERRALLTGMADHQPPETEVSTVGHLHGAFHAGHLRYGGAGNVTAVLGWDAMTTGPVAGELVRAAAALFAFEDERGLDLDRVRSFVRGHRAAFPLDAGQIQSAVHRAWWERLCDVGPLRHRYIAGTRAGEGTGADPGPADGAGDGAGAAALVGWWSEHLDGTLELFAAPYGESSDETSGDSAYG
ncbi:phosphotransferase enzyme family protein [Actinomadura sp. 9N407]|uniref:phosphotransferase enzyme family protein n=1 Tax=Actinomadura sp. 9N407 TaxID=3375154 RepID=UPI0037BAB747